MNTAARPLASKEEWQLRNKLSSDPNCQMEDEYGNPGEPWQRALCNKLLQLEASRKWSPTPMEKDGRHGLWNQFEEKICVPPIYDAIGEFPELETYETEFINPVPACNNGRWGLVSPDGLNRTLLPFEYQEIEYFSRDNVIRLKQHGRYGLVFLPSEDIILRPGFPCIADDIYYDDLIDRFVFRIGKKLGLVGVTDALFDGFRLFDDERESIVAIQDGRSGFLTLTGDFFAMDSTFLPGDTRRLHHFEHSPKEED